MSTALPPELDPRGRHRGARRSRIRPLARVVGALVSVGLLVLAGYTWAQFRDLNDNVSRLSGLSVGPGNDRPDIDGKDQNILLVGNDDRSNMSDREVKELHVGRGTGSLATDTMMIVHVPADGSRASLISLPRDTHVAIPDGYITPNLLNSPYASAYVEAKKAGKSDKKAREDGANLLLKTVTNLTGLTINHYVQIGLLGFYRLAGALDGITVTLCHDVDDRHSTNVANGDDGGSGFHLSKGRHTLTALQALEFVRQRHNLEGGDLGRVKRQQYFLTAAFRQVASVGVLFQLRELGDALKRSVYLDDKLDLIELAKQLESLSANRIVGRTIPTYTGADGLTADPAKVRRFVRTLISPPSPSSSSASASSTPPRRSSTAPSAPKASSSASAIDAKCIN